MKLTVLTWLKDSSIPFIGKIIEILFRLILLILPLGIFLYLIQSRDKASTIRTINVYTTEDSKWQHIFPGFILVAIDPNALKNSYKKTLGNIQSWISSHKYLLEALFMVIIIVLMYISGVAK